MLLQRLYRQRKLGLVTELILRNRRSVKIASSFFLLPSFFWHTTLKSLQVMSTLTEINTLNTANSESVPTENGQDSPAVKSTFTLEEIQKLLPHRYPFALVPKTVD